MRKSASINIGTLVAVTCVFFGAYHLLLCDHSMNLSIAEIVALSHHQSVNMHLLILGLIPVYIAIVIFGAGSISLYLGAFLQNRINRFFGFSKAST